MPIKPVRVGVIGAGMISAQYLQTLQSLPDLNVVAVGDLDVARARGRATEFEIPFAGSSNDLIAHPDVEVIINLTIPAAHAEVSALALVAGKHVWSEKPIATTLADAGALVELAATRQLRLGVAPDTILGPGMQAAVRAVRRGAIGTPVAATAVMQYPGPDIFHPDPDFLFAPGAGPLFDMGPYYVAALVCLLGPVARVTATGVRSREVRTITTGPRAGATVPVLVPTHVAALIEFTGGRVAQLTLSFDSPLVRIGRLEVMGTDATLAAPDPNTFDSEARLTRPATFEELDRPPLWEVLPASAHTTGRGLGVLDLARAVRADRPHAADGLLALHVLETLIRIDEAASDGAWHTVHSTVDPVRLDLDDAEPTAVTL
jgi:predicted dehydrogenase